MRCLLLIGLVVAAAGLFDCAHSGRRMTDAEFMQRVKEYNQEVPKEEQIHCERIRPIGSNIPQLSCRRLWSKDAETLRTQDVMRRMQRTLGKSGD